jgi:tetratricopeptide (TPR) repeat protein
MAEGLLRGLLGKEGEEPKSEGASEAPVGVDAFAAAVAAIASRQDPEVARRTADFLRGQLHLTEVQAKHLEDEHELRLRHLRNQLGEETVRRFGLRLRVGFQLFLALVATVIGVGGAVMLRDAFSSRSVVVEAFDAPLALAARGVTGKVIAGGVLDELNRLQAATKSSAAKRNLSNAWASEVKLAVPEAGISIGEISRLLKARFGHDLHIDGALVETSTGGLALTVRGDGVQSQTFTGAAGELNKLATEAAEYVYAESQPALWASYLSQTGHDQEAIAFCRAAFARAAMSDRPYLLNTWANSLQNSGGSQGEALTLYRAALKIKPEFWVAYSNVMNALWLLGDEEGAWRSGEDMRKAAGGRPGG